MARLSFSSDDSAQSDFSTTSTAASSICSDNNVFAKAENYAFNDRRPEVRDARIANALLALDDELPMDLDESIKDLIKSHIANLESFEIKSQQLYAELKQRQIDRKANEKKLPISRRGRERKESKQMQI